MPRSKTGLLHTCDLYDQATAAAMPRSNVCLSHHRKETDGQTYTCNRLIHSFAADTCRLRAFNSFQTSLVLSQRHRLTLPCRRQIVEYVYFALAMAVCLILTISALTNCPFLAGFFTLVLLVLTLIYSIVAAILFIIASIGNDA